MLALKVINKRKRQEDAFKHEQLLLQGMLDTSHPHIIQLLATYHQDDFFHFLFPLAECNLEQYMDQNEPKRSREHVIWILNQIEGLAEGLQVIHDNSKRAEPSQLPDSTLHPRPLTR